LNKTENAAVRVPFGRRELAIVGALLLGAFLVRFAFFSNQGYAKVDTVDFMSWFQTAANVGIRNFYNQTWCDYPPFNVYIFWVFGILAKSLGVFGSSLFTYVMKLPANLIDMATAFLIFAFVRKRINFRWALLATALYAFNPAVIFNAAVWGQFDAIYTFLLILSLFLIFNNKPNLAVVAYVLGILTKPQSIALAPLFFYLIWRKADWKSFLTSIGVAAGTIFLVVIPFEFSNPLTFLSNLYVGAYSEYRFTSLNAFNIWGFGGMWVPDTTATFILGWAMFAALAALTLYFVNKRSSSNYELTVLFAAFVLFFGFFMLPTRIHERYLFPAMAVLALMFPFLRKTRPLYVALTATCFVNQAYVLSFLNAGTFIQPGDPVVFIVSLINSIALIYVLILMVQDIRQNRRTETLPLQPQPLPFTEKQEPAETPPLTASVTSEPEPSKQEEHNPRISIPKLDRRDWLAILALCIVFFSVATYALGYTQTPVTQTQLYPGQSFYLDLGNQSRVGSIYFLIHDGSFTVSVYTGSPGDWQLSSANVSFSNYYQWEEVGIGQTTQYIRVDISAASDAAFEEIAVSNSNNKQIVIQNVTGIDSQNPDLQNLIDEQNKIQMPLTYMSQTYFDEIYFVKTAAQYLHLQSPYEWTHPPLGKLIQAAGIVVFGFSPFGWRFMGVIFATLMIPVIYLLGKKLFGSWIGAFSAAFLLTFDFLHFTMGRMGTADTYVVFFELLSLLFFFIYFADVVKKGWRTSFLPLFLAVIFFFLSFSTKWLFVYGAIGMIALLVILRLKDVSKIKEGFSHKYAAFFDHPFMLLLAFILLGIGIYFLIYIPDMLTGRPFFGTNGVLELQLVMYHYHATLTATHPFESPWWSWPLMINPLHNVTNINWPAYVPLWLDVTYFPNGNVVSTISAMGNPAIWWVGFVCLIFIMLDIVGLDDLVGRLRSSMSKGLQNQESIPAAVQASNMASKSERDPAELERHAHFRNSIIMAAGFAIFIVTAIMSEVVNYHSFTLALPIYGGLGMATFGMVDNLRGKHEPKDIAPVFITVVFLFSWIPYTFLSRVTFIYHYYECVPFVFLATAYFIDKYWGTRWGKIATMVFFAVVIAMFIVFYPVISGMPVSSSWIHGLKWFPSWYFAP
jgi:Gpi18-like mannosyltransferase/4-amino-4-deoxy-L-arabinose transferase-like glycosyltransferase